jgi:hypothetical protein
VEFINFTNTHKSSFVQRFYDNKPLGEPMTYSVRPRTIHRYRVPPGIYEFGVKMDDGRIHAWRTARALWACEKVSIPMEIKEPPKERKIRSRRSLQGG